MKMNQKGVALWQMVATFVVTVLVLFIPLSFWTERNLNFWMTHFKHMAVHVPFYLSVIISIIGNWVIVVANIIAEIARCLI